ncbi:helix-turn-helix domain-containing protein [Microterricola viridarii]|uniref:Helix-turn-helix domain-containing protein n=1 Tax=Microterricola viridarii TaxID=412690 RepID=A0A1H1R4A4_9MICO|nr:helix-turn-helix domain-containing protein [Microterricola viridarii]SDS30405.1 Helix-turn-helix domain-containing protein [Microterricola viridarii]
MPAAAPDDALGRFVTLGDTAEILKISVDEALALVRSGELPAIRVGRAADTSGGASRWRVERTVLEAYIEGKYEETRRMGLWNQAEFANIPELSGGTIVRGPGTPPAADATDED